MTNKHALYFLLLILFTSQVRAAIKFNPMDQIIINSGWEFSEAHKNSWRGATVPGTIHQDLISHDLLPNPFFGLNEEKIQWVENKDWEYRTIFNLTKEQLSHHGALLSLEGLDTYADVYLNGARIIQADNMFVGHQCNVKDVLREGENRLYIYFHSPINRVLSQWASNGFDYPADNDHHEKKLSVFTRKAPYSYGWDWGIRMATSGIWRPITLQLYDGVRVDDVFINQKTLTESLATVDVEIEYSGLENYADLTLQLSYLHEKESDIVAIPLSVKQGSHKLTIPIEIKDPKLWMPNGWGEPNLYDFKVKILKGDVIIADKEVRTGFKTIKLIQEKEADGGESFYFLVNGKPLFAKGANYIPHDALLPNVTKERYETLFRDIKEANMNMVRVWGGGTYEDDYFYQLADENGILVWQDFMFACTTYPSDAKFIRGVEKEAIYNVKRLRNYASLALWCGNNEILEGIQFWGWKKRYSEAIYEEMKAGYQKLFYELLPNVINKYDSNCSYVHGSPYFANWGRPDSWKIGDSHNWGIWYGRKPFESLDIELSRFMSEFGFQAFPEMKTIATFAKPEDYQLESDVMNGHQKSSVGNELIEKSMELYYHVPKKFEDLVYVGLVLQGRGMRHGFEAHRRNRPYCMGSLYWQLNDSWPVVSWSSLDYYGNWKALHYQAKRAFAPVALNIMRQEDELAVYGLSDLLEDKRDLSFKYEVMDFNGNILKKGSISHIDIKANSSNIIAKLPLRDLNALKERSRIFLNFKLVDDKKEVLVKDQYYFKPPKDLELPLVDLKVKKKKIANGLRVTLESKTLVKDLFIQTPVQGARFTDNFFDLIPGEKYIIEITHLKDGALIQNSELTYNHIRNTY